MLKKNLTKVLVLGSALAFSLTACGGSGDANAEAAAENCTPKHNFSTAKEGVLTVALTNTPPYSYEENGQLAGIDSDILQEFAAQECLTIEYTPFTYATAVPAVQQGQADVAIGGFYRTAARNEVVRLSAPIYLDELTVISKEGHSTVDEILGKRLGTVEGYLWVEALQQLPDTETRTFPDSLNLAQDLKAGRLDVGLDGYGAAARSVEGTDYQVKVLEQDDRVPATIEPSQTGFLMDPSNAEMGDAIDQTIGELRESGKLVEILESNGLPASAAEVGDSRLI